MGWFSWLKFLRPKKESNPEVDLARGIAVRVGQKADAIQESLKVYHRAQDPFAAMLADLYNRDQLTRVWKNGGGTGAGHG